MKLNLITLTFLAYMCTTNALNILGIFPYQGKSHFFVFRIYLRELARRGHNVTVISHFPESNPPNNYTDISLAGTIKIVEDALPFERSYSSLIGISWFLVSSGIKNCQVMLENEQVQDLIKQKPKFDVVVLEQFNSDCALGIAYKLGAPVVGLSSNSLMPYHYPRFGVLYNPAFVSNHFLEGGTKPSLYQRVERVVFDFYFRALFSLITQRINQQSLAQYFDDIPPLEELGREIKFLMLYHNFILTGSNIFPSNVIEVGGYHVPPPKPISGDLKKFVDEAENGVIYISFGSLIKSATMPADKLNHVLAAIEELPHRVIWKWEDHTIMTNRNKLYVSDWLPQVDILGHPKTMAFISHAGMGGTTEAIHFGVPVIAMPVIGDQPFNAAAIEESGLGVTLPIDELTKENLLKALKVVLDPKFRENVKLVSKAWHDRPMPPLETAVFWTEFAARNPNFIFRTAAADVPMYQYYNLDILLIFGSLFTVAIIIIYKSIKKVCCVHKVPKTRRNKKTKTQ